MKIIRITPVKYPLLPKLTTNQSTDQQQKLDCTRKNIETLKNECTTPPQNK